MRGRGSSTSIEARSDRAVSRIIQKISRFGLLILDELGYVPFSREGSQLLFQLLSEKYERVSPLDRLAHKAHIIVCDWESYRLKESLKKKSLINKDKI